MLAYRLGLVCAVQELSGGARGGRPKPPPRGVRSLKGALVSKPPPRFSVAGFPSEPVRGEPPNEGVRVSKAGPPRPKQSASFKQGGEPSVGGGALSEPVPPPLKTGPSSTAPHPHKQVPLPPDAGVSAVPPARKPVPPPFKAPPPPKPVRKEKPKGVLVSKPVTPRPKAGSPSTLPPAPKSEPPRFVGGRGHGRHTSEGLGTLLFHHPFRTPEDGAPAAAGDVMGPDVHHAVVGVELVRKVIRGDAARGVSCVGIHSVLETSPRGSHYRLVDTVSVGVCPAILLRHVDRPTLVVAVAPTQTVEDVLLDCKVRLGPPPEAAQTQLGLPPDVRLHRGWAGAAASLWRLVRPKVAAAQAAEAAARGLPPTAQPLRVVFAGHSLGAAMATLLAVGAAGAATPPGPRVPLVTLGGPRVGDAVLQAVVAARTAHTRVVVAGDSVPRMPFGMTTAALRAPCTYAPVSAGRHWRLGGVPAAPAGAGVSAHKADSADRSETPVLRGLLIGFFTCHPYDVYLARLLDHYDKLVEGAAATGEGSSPR